MSLYISLVTCVMVSLFCLLSCKGESKEGKQSAGNGSNIVSDDSGAPNDDFIDEKEKEKEKEVAPVQPQKQPLKSDPPFIPDRLVKHDRPCDGQPVGACVFQARSFLHLNDKTFEVIVARDNFYIYQIIKGYNDRKFYYKDYEMGYGKKISDIFKQDLTTDSNKKCANCSIDSLDVVYYANKEPVISISRANFYENYKFNAENKTWHEWFPGSTLTSILGRYVKGTSSADASKFPCDAAKPEACKFDTRTLSTKSYGQLESISTNNRYYNFVRKPDNTIDIWPSNGSNLGDVPRYRLGPCKERTGNNCKFDTRTFHTENNIEYESISAYGKYFVFFKDALGKEQMWQGSLDDITRYKSRANGLNAIVKHGLSGGNCQDNALMDAQWGYNWGWPQNINSEHCKDQEFVGMIWGPRLETYTAVASTGPTSSTNNSWTLSTGDLGQPIAAVKLKHPKTHSTELTFKGFDLRYIPDDSQVLGIKVRIKRHNASSTLGQIRDVETVLIKADGQRSTSKALAQDWPAASVEGPQQFYTYGAIDDKWGFTNITMADLKNKDFSFSIKVLTSQNTNEVEAKIEYVALRVFYIPSLAFTKANSRSEYLLGFNEPNGTRQANLTPEEGAFLWNEVEKTYANNYKLIAPSPAQHGGDPNNDGGIKWLRDFRAAFLAKYKKDPKLHALPVHCYIWWGNPNDEVYDSTYCKNLTQAYINLSKEWKLPQGVWITEFGLVYSEGSYNDWEASLGTQSVVALKEGIKDLVSWFISHNDVYRYAWFTHRQGDDCFATPPNYNCTKTPTFIYKTTNPTYIGEIYRNFGEE
ncbi:MAG: hypothetical protein KBD78_08430 [Oligoflexales bacterium]|nr:hypothetical protein [Oligoflexales bacterium]